MFARQKSRTCCQLYCDIVDFRIWFWNNLFVFATSKLTIGFEPFHTPSFLCVNCRTLAFRIIYEPSRKAFNANRLHIAISLGVIFDDCLDHVTRKIHSEELRKIFIIHITAHDCQHVIVPDKYYLRY